MFPLFTRGLKPPALSQKATNVRLMVPRGRLSRIRTRRPDFLC